MDAKDFHGFADELSTCAMRHQEATDRTTISRLYYGCFLCVEEWLDTHYKKDYRQVNGGTHFRVTKCLSDLAEKLNRPDMEELAESLRNFKGDRVVADYKMNNPVGSVNVNNAKNKKDEAMHLFGLVKLNELI